MSEELYPRKKSTNRYEYDGRLLNISNQIIQKTYYLLSLYQKHSVEAACFWYGEKKGDTEIVKAVGIIDQENYPSHFKVLSEGFEVIASCLEHTGWTNLAQIHTHPGKNVEHSGYDDIYVNSRRALSLVLPFFGKPQKDPLTSMGVHQFQDDYWHLLNFKDASRRVRIAGDERGVILDARTFNIK